MTIAEAAIKLRDRSNEEIQKSDFTNILCSSFIMRDLSVEGIVDGTWSAKVSSAERKHQQNLKPQKFSTVFIYIIHRSKKNVLIWANKIIFQSLRHKNASTQGDSIFQGP